MEMIRSKRKRAVGAAESGSTMLSPSPVGTGVIVAACLMAALVPVEDAAGMTAGLRIQAILVGLGLGLSLLLDYQGSLRNLVRVDVVCLAALYFLGYVEFLFPQPGFELTAQGFGIGKAADLVLLGMAALAVGRHADALWTPPAPKRSGLIGGGLHVRHWFVMLWIAAGLGYAHMLLAVNFNPVALIEEMIKPRFSQPWGRGKFGDWKALLFELSLFLNVIPPIYGVLLANRRTLDGLQFGMATIVALLTMFHGFSCGTRNVFATYLAGMLGAYLLVQPRLDLMRVVATGLVGGALLYVSTQQMLAFRQIGLGNYLRYGNPESTMTEEESGGFFVDANLLNIAMLVQAFDTRHEPLGMNVPYNALVRPIPRAIWPGKPEGLAVGIEEAVGMEGLTLSVTFVGEGYMMARTAGVAIVGLFFGACCGLWNALFRHRHGAFPRLVYATGFFAAAISMRSLFVFTTAILPVIGLLVLAWWLRSGEEQGTKVRRRSAPRRDIREESAGQPETATE